MYVFTFSEVPGKTWFRYTGMCIL